MRPCRLRMPASLENPALPAFERSGQWRTDDGQASGCDTRCGAFDDTSRPQRRRHRRRTTDAWRALAYSTRSHPSSFPGLILTQEGLMFDVTVNREVASSYGIRRRRSTTRSTTRYLVESDNAIEGGIAALNPHVDFASRAAIGGKRIAFRSRLGKSAASGDPQIRHGAFITAPHGVGRMILGRNDNKGAVDSSSKPAKSCAPHERLLASLRRATIAVTTPRHSENTSCHHLAKVESIDVDQTLTGRLFNYGNVTIRGTGSSNSPHDRRAAETADDGDHELTGRFCAQLDVARLA